MVTELVQRYSGNIKRLMEFVVEIDKLYLQNMLTIEGIKAINTIYFTPGRQDERLEVLYTFISLLLRKDITSEDVHQYIVELYTPSYKDPTLYKVYNNLMPVGNDGKISFPILIQYTILLKLMAVDVVKQGGLAIIKEKQEAEDLKRKLALVNQNTNNDRGTPNEYIQA